MQIGSVSIQQDDQGFIAVSFVVRTPSAVDDPSQFTVTVENPIQGKDLFIEQEPVISGDEYTFPFTEKLKNVSDREVTISNRDRTLFQQSVTSPASFEGPFSDGRTVVQPEDRITDYVPRSNEAVDARVYVNDVELPAGDVTVHARKEGPVDVARYAEFQFASPWDGEDYADILGTLDPVTQSNFDEVYIEGRDYATGDFFPVFRGVVTGVSSAPSVEQLWQGRARGPGLLLDKFPVDKTFGNYSTFPEIRNVYRFVLGQLNERLPADFAGTPAADSEEFDDRIPTDADTRGGDEFVIGANEPGPNIAIPTAEGAKREPKQKEFHPDKHTLSDVVAWADERLSAFTWFRPTRDGIQFVLRDQPRQRQYNAHYLGGDVFVEDNDALAQLQPENAIVVRGKTEGSSGDTYSVVEARHQPLYERAGNTTLYASVDERVDARTKDEVEAKARTKLKKAIDAATDATINTMAVTPINPFDTVEAKPTVDGSEATDTPSLTYEVHRVRHEFTAAGLPRTVLNVGVHTDIEEDITILDNVRKEA
jgi:hypothetical protein